jgi:arginyl-tRNA synthetase
MREPHRLAFYLYDLASHFHSHWNKGKEKQALRFINESDRQSTIAKLGLVSSVAAVLRSGLALTGTDAPQEMR